MKSAPQPRLTEAEQRQLQKEFRRVSVFVLISARTIDEARSMILKLNSKEQQ